MFLSVIIKVNGLTGTKLKPNTDQQKSEKESPKDVTKSTETTPETTPIQKVSPKTTPTEKVSPDTATKADKSSRDSSVSPQEQVEVLQFSFNIFFCYEFSNRHF